MRKILVFILSLMIVFSIASCSKKESKPAEEVKIKTEISKTNEGAVSNALFINSIDIDKSYAKSSISFNLEKGILAFGAEQLPFENISAVEDVIINVLSNLKLNIESVSDISNIVNSFSINYSGENFISIKNKFENGKLIYNVPELLDKSILVDPNKINDSSDIETFNFIQKLSSIKEDNEELKSAFRKVMMHSSKSLEKHFIDKKMISEPVDKELKTESGNIKVKEYELKLDIQKIVDILINQLEMIKSNKEFKADFDNLFDKIVDTLVKKHIYKEFYKNADVNEKTFREDIAKSKEKIDNLFKDENIDKLISQLDFQKIIKEKPDVAVIAMMSFDFQLLIDESHILRGIDLNIKSPFFKVQVETVVDSINESVKKESIGFSKDKIEVDFTDQTAFDKYEDEVKQNILNLFENKAYKSFINDLKEGSKNLAEADKNMFITFIEILETGLKSKIEGL